MKYLKDERAWRKWIQTVAGATWRDYSLSYSRPPLRIRAPAPTEYPCWAYSVAQSFRDEEEAPEYLYRADLERMLARLGT